MKNLSTRNIQLQHWLRSRFNNNDLTHVGPMLQLVDSDSSNSCLQSSWNYSIIKKQVYILHIAVFKLHIYVTALPCIHHWYIIKHRIYTLSSWRTNALRHTYIYVIQYMCWQLSKVHSRHTVLLLVLETTVWNINVGTGSSDSVWAIQLVLH